MFELFQEYPEIFYSCIVLMTLMFFYFIYRVSKAYKAAKAKYHKVVFGLRNSHEGAVLKAQLDMQEYTFQMISREVHDNIGQNLSLAKLILNTQSFEDPNESAVQVHNSVKMVRTAIKDLGDVADTMNSDIMKYNGLVKAIEAEVK